MNSYIKTLSILFSYYGDVEHSFNMILDNLI